MNILISGGTGLIGSLLCSKLKKKHRLTIISRKSYIADRDITFVNSFEEIRSDEHFDACINLAGEPIAQKRWSMRQKNNILSSRLNMTEDFISFFRRVNSLPSVFISGSAIGFYGIEDTSDNVTEEGLGDLSFSSSLCRQWEAAAMKAESMGVRTCLLRTGVVLSLNGGALKKMMPAYKYYLGGPIGSGMQWMSWIHISDLIGIIEFSLYEKSLRGAINCTAPEPVTNMNFSAALGEQLHRPTGFRIPAFIIILLMGSMGRELLLSGKKILPTKISRLGYVFEFNDIKSALEDLCN